MANNKTFACMATFPARFATLYQVVDSILSQVDGLFVYLNESDEVPACLKRPEVHVFLSSQEAGNLSANGKVYALQFIEESYVFLIDDDFVFPPDYVSRMKKVIDQFGRGVCVGAHGSIFAPGARWYYERSTVYPWWAGVSEHKLVQMLGSGCLAFHLEGLKVRFEDFLPRVMVDLTFAIKAKQQRIPMLTIKRPANWTKPLRYEGLYQDFSRGMTWHTSAMQEHQPWSAELYLDLIRNFFVSRFGAFDAATARALDFDSEVIHAIETGRAPRSWGRTLTALRHRNSFLKLRGELAADEGAVP